ncbi:MAG: SPOR domain-containing protein [Pseudomonadota bacterium]
MARDFGQRGENSGRHARGKGELPGWIWGLVGLSAGLAVAALIYIAKPIPPTEVTSGKDKATIRKSPIVVPPKEPSRFSFYELLPSYEVVIPRGETEEEKPVPIAEPGTYVIQVASYRERKQAEEQKAQLALLGIESRIEQVTIDNNQNWFRVRIGPEEDLGKLHLITARLAENKIKGVVMRVEN